MALEELTLPFELTSLRAENLAGPLRDRAS